MKDNYFYKSQRGLTKKAVEEISILKKEPKWMRDFRLAAYEEFVKASFPKIKDINLSEIDYKKIYSFIQPIKKQAKNWDNLPKDIKNTYEKLNIPLWERKYLSGLSTQYESMIVYKKAKEELDKKGVIFIDMDTAVKKYPNLLKQYFGKVILPSENKFAALNSAFWSGGVFIYIPKKVKLKLPLQSFFYINFKQLGQFERTLIVTDEGSESSYIEGCAAPIYQSYSLHTGLVEIIVKKAAKIKFTTVQNWSKNIYNFSFKKALVDKKGQIEWVMATLGAKITMGYPTTILHGEKAKMSYLGLTIASENQTQSTGAKVIHQASSTSAEILSKSISSKGGKTIFRGLIKAPSSFDKIKSYMRCHSLIMDKTAKSYSYPFLEIENEKSKVAHEATFGGLSEEQLFYLRSRGLNTDQATALLINGFISPITKDLPIDYAIEIKRLIEMETKKL